MEKVTTTMRIPKSLDDKVMNVVEELGISKNAVYILILNEYFKQQDAMVSINELMSKVQQLERDSKN